MTDSGTEVTPRLDALLPPEMAKRAEEIGVKKAIEAFDPDFVAANTLGLHAPALTWGGFLLRNLLPVTMGNVTGGTVLVGAVYWFVYLRPRAAS